MDVNYLLVIFGIILVVCILRGARRGVVRIVFGLLSWIFLIWFVNFSTIYISDYLTINSPVEDIIQEHISEYIHNRYTVAEEEQTGTGAEAIIGITPAHIKAEITETIQTSIDNTIALITDELTKEAIKGLSTIISVMLGSIVIYLIDKLLRFIGFVPGVRDVNRLLGVAAGFAEGMLIIWVIMYLAECFPTTTYGQYVLENTMSDQLLTSVYQLNVIKQIIGI